MSATTAVNTTIAEARDAARYTNWPRAELTKKQEEQWDETRTAMLWQAPFFAHLFYAKCETIFSPAVPIAATDGRALVFNPETFFKFKTKERVFIACHEIAHVVWMHCILGYSWKKQGYVTNGAGKRIKYDDDAHAKMNIAMDYVINALLTAGNVGSRPDCAMYDTSMSADGTEAVIDVFTKMPDPPKQDCQGGKGKGDGSPGNGPEGPGQTGFDKHLDPGATEGQTPHQAQQERAAEAQSWANAVTQAAVAARAQGKMPANMDRLVGEIIEPAIDWKEHIQGFFNRKVGNTGYSWRHPDRRLLARTEAIIAPGRSGNGCGDIAVGVDTSGSIGDKEIAMFFGCLGGILEDLRPRRLIVIWCDARVHRVDELEDTGELYALRKRGAPGGGGTRFEPVFEEVDKLGLAVDALVYLTDTYGSFPATPPAYPVLWATLGKHSVPFGEAVEIPPEFAK